MTSADPWPPGRGWQPVALGVDIAPGTAAGTRLFGQEIAVWRDAHGGVHVWEDRCPHRGMRLSFGFVRGGRLSCLYHGWQFDPAGRCRFIPAHPALDVPASITVTRYPAAEQAGLVWVFSGEAPPEPPPGAEGAAVPVRSLAIVAAPGRVAAALAAVAPGWAGPLAPVRAADDHIAVALQPLSAGETCLHLSVVAPEGPPAAAQARVSLWGEALRRSVEGASA